MYGNEDRLSRRTNRHRLYSSQRNATLACGIFLGVQRRDSQQDYMRTMYKRNVRERFIENSQNKSNDLLAPTQAFACCRYSHTAPRGKGHLLFSQKQKNRKRLACRRGFSRSIIRHNSQYSHFIRQKQTNKMPLLQTKSKYATLNRAQFSQNYSFKSKKIHKTQTMPISKPSL